jgi:spermidine synthase
VSEVMPRSFIKAQPTERNRYFIYLSLFCLSGFSGLIYESIWTHYLKLYLGHAAYAQTLVLIIFMGGMAIGSAVAGRYGFRIPNILRAYAVLEILIGIAAILFHDVFTDVIEFSYTELFPSLGSPASIAAAKWSAAALLILPQSILLGATFPFMSSGIVRRFPKNPGKSLATLYFLNSLGAAIGVLTSGFFLIPKVGLPGTVAIAGVTNIILGCLVWVLARRDGRDSIATNTKGRKSEATFNSTLVGFLLIAGITGAASFLYEIAWIRMLSMVLGSTTHAFELMLSAFIFGLAIGGFIIHKKIDLFHSPTRVLGWIQILMGLLAAVTLAQYSIAFESMSYAVGYLEKNETGYLLFNLISHSIALAIMLPATICAGMTLPLISFSLIKRGYSESSIGFVYASNTVGAIVGVILAVQLILPTFGLKAVILTGAILDVALGIFILRISSANHQRKVWSVTAIVSSFVLAIFAFSLELDPVKMASGVYLSGETERYGEIRFQQHGKTATITTFGKDQYLAVSTNGKIEAAIDNANTTKDEPTMTLAGLLPLAIHPDAQKLAVIGIGSGLTSHTVLNHPKVKIVDTIEIEPAMVNASRQFGYRVNNLFSDQRSRIHIEDAKVFFASQGVRYDVIISEPSNPWVSGVAGLFTTEFYELIPNYLNNDGLLIQWLHLYHLKPALVASVIKAIDASGFSDYAIYALNQSDIAIIASNRSVPAPSSSIFHYKSLQKDLSNIGVESEEDLNLRLIGYKSKLQPFFNSYKVPVNSDYYPYLDYQASKSRYLNDNAEELLRLARIPNAFLEALGQEPNIIPKAELGSNLFMPLRHTTAAAKSVLAYLINPSLINSLPELKPLSSNCINEYESTQWIGSIHKLSDAMLTYFRKSDLQPIWDTIEQSKCYDFLSDTGKNWLQLYRALDERDHSEVALLVDKLLPNGDISASLGNDFLLASGTIAHYKLQDQNRAKEFLHRQKRKTETGVLERYVLATISDAMQLKVNFSEIKN